MQKLFLLRGIRQAMPMQERTIAMIYAMQQIPMDRSRCIHKIAYEVLILRYDFQKLPTLAFLHGLFFCTQRIALSLRTSVVQQCCDFESLIREAVLAGGCG